MLVLGKSALLTERGQNRLLAHLLLHFVYKFCVDLSIFVCSAVFSIQVVESNPTSISIVNKNE